MDWALGSYCGIFASTLRSILLLGNIWITICTCISLRKTKKMHALVTQVSFIPGFQQEGNSRRVSCLWIPSQFSFSSGSLTACMDVHRNRGHQSIDGGRQKSATKSKGLGPHGSFPSVVLNLAMVCVLTTKSICKCQRSSRKTDGCTCGYHVNQNDNAFPSTSVCDKKTNGG